MVWNAYKWIIIYFLVVYELGHMRCGPLDLNPWVDPKKKSNMSNFIDSNVLSFMYKIEEIRFGTWKDRPLNWAWEYHLSLSCQAILTISHILGSKIGLFRDYQEVVLSMNEFFLRITIHAILST